MRLLAVAAVPVADQSMFFMATSQTTEQSPPQVGLVDREVTQAAQAALAVSPSTSTIFKED